nr:adenosylcobinamide-phosphate synthase CbiB [uncultured Dethiosulfovibrio sp.]
MIQTLSVLILAVLVDRLIGEPPEELHPVCWMGKFIEFAWNRRPTKGLFLYGAFMVASGTVSFAMLGTLVSLVWWPVSFVFSVWFLKGTMSASALLEAGREVYVALVAGDLAQARGKLAWHLVSRETSDLSSQEIAGAAVESLSENLSDGWVAPILAYSLFGLPGALAYRFVNTCDSMVGYRHGDFELGGKASALLDDLFNILPARLSALLLVVGAWSSKVDWRGAIRSSFRFHRATESPNAGWPMAAMAGALGITLTKRGCYSIPGGDGDPDVEDLYLSMKVVSVAQLATVAFGFALIVGMR